MIRYQADQPTTVRSNVRGGDGSYESRQLFSPEEVDKTTLFAVNTMPPGASIGVHSHTTEGEAYVILAGEAVVQEDGTDYVLHAGDCEYCTGGHTHAIANRSEAPMQFLAIIIK